MAKYYRTIDVEAAYNTCFSWEGFEATPKQLETAFGKPESGSDDFKTTKEWWFISDKGRPFTIYDWKEYRELKSDEVVTWHIGALPGEKNAKDFKKYVENMIK